MPGTLPIGPATEAGRGEQVVVCTGGLGQLDATAAKMSDDQPESIDGAMEKFGCSRNRPGH